MHLFYYCFIRELVSGGRSSPVGHGPGPKKNSWANLYVGLGGVGTITLARPDQGHRGVNQKIFFLLLDQWYNQATRRTTTRTRASMLPIIRTSLTMPTGHWKALVGEPISCVFYEILRKWLLGICFWGFRGKNFFF